MASIFFGVHVTTDCRKTSADESNWCPPRFWCGCPSERTIPPDEIDANGRSLIEHAGIRKKISPTTRPDGRRLRFCNSATWVIRATAMQPFRLQKWMQVAGYNTPGT